MRTFPTLALIPVAAIMLMACSDDEASTDSVAATAAPTTDAATPTSEPAATEPQGTEPLDTTPVTAIDGPVQIDVVVGVDSGEDRVEKVRVGADVTLNITNPNAADEFHIHGIDLEQAVDAGVMATFNFVADTPGTYEVESHTTEDVLVVIEVS